MAESFFKLNQNILEIQNLSVHFSTEDGLVKAVQNISFEVPLNKTIALLGESGCGKSVTALSVLQLIEPPGRIVEGEILFGNTENSKINLLQFDADSEEMRFIRGKDIAMIFQEPMISLTPVYSIGEQIIEAIALHQEVSRKECWSIAIELLRQVGIPAPEIRMKEYPHQLSGGMCQRVMIAIALSCQPKLLIADEPTTALDVTIQAQVLEILKEIQKSYGTSILLITHDLGVVSEIADEVVVMYLGQIVERGRCDQILRNPRHPYTRGLLSCIPNPSSSRGLNLPFIPGMVPDPFDIPTGCPFRNRCCEEMIICNQFPQMVQNEDGSKVYCWLYE